MIDFDLIKNILIVAICSSIISTAVIQKLKENLKSKKWLLVICFIITMTIGILFSLTFTKYNIIYSCWVGLISFVGADAIYQTFEDKIFTSFKNITNTSGEEIINIERDEKNDSNVSL